MTEDRPVYRVLSTRSIVWLGISLVLVAAGVAAVLLMAYGGGTEADKIRLDAIRTAGTIVVGTGGVVALWLAARRQQSSEIALRQKDLDQAHAERVFAQSEHDSAERRVTDLYTKAVEQLGAQQAPVRLGGMYALERLAQNVPDQRQTIVNVLCAYLRMPYEVGDGEPQKQEREVRLTAQRILTTHLAPNLGQFWAGIDVDFNGATLLDFDLTGCMVRRADFRSSHFEGSARFHHTDFIEIANFTRAIFNGGATLGAAVFHSSAWFYETEFRDRAVFEGAHFHSGATFEGALFGSLASFEGSIGELEFDDARVRLGTPAFRRWPDGFTVAEDSDDELEGHDGRWGYVVPAS